MENNNRFIIFFVFRYKQAISVLNSAVFDPMVSDPDNAVWWTEYLLRHRNIRLLRSPAVGVSFFKYYLLDVVCYLFLITFVTLLGAYIIIQAILKRLCSRFSHTGGLETKGKFKAL